MADEDNQFRFERLEVWQRAVDMAITLGNVADQLATRHLYRFAEQLRAAAAAAGQLQGDGAAAVQQGPQNGAGKGFGQAGIKASGEVFRRLMAKRVDGQRQRERHPPPCATTRKRRLASACSASTAPLSAGTDRAPKRKAI